MAKTEHVETPTWYELRKFCMDLTGDQLGQPVLLEGIDDEDGYPMQITGIERNGDKLKLTS